MKSINAFSLIEMIIVLSIIGLLSAITIPNFISIQNKAKESSVKAAAHTLQLYIETYFLETGDYPDDTTIDDLLTTLSDESILTSSPENPFTNTTYTSSDSAGAIIYTVSETGTYEISAYDADGSEIILTLDNN